MLIMAVLTALLFISCPQEPGKAEIPPVFRNTEWMHPEGASISFTRNTVTTITASGEEETFTLIDILYDHYFLQLGQTMLLFGISPESDFIIYQDDTIYSVTLGGITLTGSWKLYEDILDDSYGDFQYSYGTVTLTITIKGYTGSGGPVIIPGVIDGKRVIAIGEQAFSRKKLTSVIIPFNIASIGDEAFFDNQLIRVTIGNSVTSIGDSAFIYNQLKSVTIPDSVISIGYSAFYENELSSITIGNSVTTIEDRAFSSNQLVFVTIPDSVTSIGDEAFSANQLTSAIIGGSVTSIGDEAFSANQLENVTIGSSVTSIGNQAFSANQLTSITIPDSVTSIGKQAFYDNKLISVTIGNSDTTIGDEAFSANQLTSITIGANVTLGSDSFDNSFHAAYNRNKAGIYTRPNAASNNWTFKANLE